MDLKVIKKYLGIRSKKLRVKSVDKLIFSKRVGI